MSNNYLIEEKVVTIKKEVCKSIPTLAGIDRGCSLTKVLYATEKDVEHYNLHFALFSNQHFEEGLDYLKQKKIVKSADGKLHVTGAGCDRYREGIKEKLNLEIEFIDEFLTQGRGTHWLLSNFSDDVICYPEVEIDTSDFAGMQHSENMQKMMEKLRQEMDLNSSKNDSKFPCIICFIGSGGAAFVINEKGESTLAGGVWLAGKSFIGLGKLLLGTNKYDEILDLAMKGTRKNIDTQIKEIIKDDPNSPYGRYPPTLPVFAFGKSADHDISIEDVKKEDLAHSLVSAFCVNVFNIIGGAAKAAGVKNIYCGGNFFRAPLIREEMGRVQEIFAGGRHTGLMEVKFLITGHTGAVGAMISSPEDTKKYLSHMKA